VIDSGQKPRLRSVNPSFVRVARHSGVIAFLIGYTWLNQLFAPLHERLLAG
jgi:hypothetical protein